MIRVLHIVGNMNKGGQETFIMNIYRNINREMVQFDFIVHGEKGYYEDEILSLEGKIYRVTPKTKNIVKYFRDMHMIFKNNKFDVVHIHSGTATVFLDAAIARHHYISNVVVHSHSTQSSNGALVHHLCQPLLNYFCTHKFACSELALEWLFGKKSLNKYSIIKNSIDVNKYTYNKDKREYMQEKLGVKGKLVIGHIGRFHPCKNHKLIIKIFNKIHSQNNESILLLIGTGKLEDEIRNEVKSLGLEKNVKFLGIRDDINELLQVIDAIIFPSLYEGFPVTVVEAQAAGVPCIISKHLTEELNITSLLSRVGIDEPIDHWSNTVLNVIQNYEKRDTSIELFNAGFDNYENARYMQSLYQDMCKIH